MPDSCLPPPGTASGTAHVLAHRDETSDAAVGALVWNLSMDGNMVWDAPDGCFFVPSELARSGYRYVGPLTMPEEVERLRAENARLREALAVCISALTDLRIGTVRYMNGPEIYGDFQSAVDYARAALRR